MPLDELANALHVGIGHLADCDQAIQRADEHTGKALALERSIGLLDKIEPTEELRRRLKDVSAQLATVRVALDECVTLTHHLQDSENPRPTPSQMQTPAAPPARDSDRSRAQAYGVPVGLTAVAAVLIGAPFLDPPWRPLVTSAGCVALAAFSVFGRHRQYQRSRERWLWAFVAIPAAVAVAMIAGLLPATPSVVLGQGALAAGSAVMLLLYRRKRSAPDPGQPDSGLSNRATGASD